MSVDRRKLVLGDWTPIVRDGIDLLRLGYVAATIAAVATGGPATNAAFSTAAAGAGRLVNLPRPFDLAHGRAM
jgi:hypothetical protein